jgi:hypothetical protein
VQVEPIKPRLKAPGTKRLKLKYGKLLSDFAFNFNLRRNNKGGPPLEANISTPPMIVDASGPKPGFVRMAG